MATTEPGITAATPNDVGRQLRAVRKAKGLSRAEVARSAGLTRRELAAYERGRTPVPESDLWCLAGSCGVDVGELLPDRDALSVGSDLGSLSVGESVMRLRAGAGSDGILREYLAMVYELRNLAPGTPTPLREDDLAQLADALGGSPDVIEERLHELIGASREEAAHLRALILGPTADAPFAFEAAFEAAGDPSAPSSLPPLAHPAEDPVLAMHGATAAYPAFDFASAAPSIGDPAAADRFFSTPVGDDPFAPPPPLAPLAFDAPVDRVANGPSDAPFSVDAAPADTSQAFDAPAGDTPFEVDAPPAGAPLAFDAPPAGAPLAFDPPPADAPLAFDAPPTDGPIAFDPAPGTDGEPVIAAGDADGAPADPFAALRVPIGDEPEAPTPPGSDLGAPSTLEVEHDPFGSAFGAPFDATSAADSPTFGAPDELESWTVIEIVDAAPTDPATEPPIDPFAEAFVVPEAHTTSGNGDHAVAEATRDAAPEAAAVEPADAHEANDAHDAPDAHDALDALAADPADSEPPQDPFTDFVRDPTDDEPTDEWFDRAAAVADALVAGAVGEHPAPETDTEAQTPAHREPGPVGITPAAPDADEELAPIAWSLTPRPPVAPAADPVAAAEPAEASPAAAAEPIEAEAVLTSEAAERIEAEAEAVLTSEPAEPIEAEAVLTSEPAEPIEPEAVLAPVAEPIEPAEHDGTTLPAAADPVAHVRDDAQDDAQDDAATDDEPTFVAAGTDWQVGGIFPATAMADDGTLALRRADVRWALADVVATGDVTIRAAVDFTSGAGFGILFRASVDDRERLTGYSFDVDPIYSGGGFLVRQWSDSRQHWKPLAHAPIADATRLYGPHTVELTLRADQLVARVDGEVVMTMDRLSRASIGAGREPCRGDRVGVQAWSTTEVTVDRMMVASL